uniref:acetylcholine receptor subunit delta-like isoform X1 n=2 Tax=Myxine glutinosa TaxID=7769 RepID=UPI00358E4F40
MLHLVMLSTLIVFCSGRRAKTEEERLLRTLMTGYQKDLRPVRDEKDQVTIFLSVTLSQLISLKETDEILTTNMWFVHRWVDYRLAWNETEFGGINKIRVPINKLWQPEIVLENNNDGQYTVSFFCNVVLSSNGLVYWLPPGIFRSFCPIRVAYYPFDWQNCTLTLRSMMYSAEEINLQLQTEDIDNKTSPIEWVVIDPEAYTENGEWEIVHKPGRRIINTELPRHSTNHQEITFNLIIRRKPLFYIINMIIPVILISFLSVLTYYLPAESGEKVSVAIAVLLSQSVFLFMVAQRLPQTSQEIPLLGRYLLFIMVSVTIVVLTNVLMLNLHHRTPNTHKLHTWMKWLFLERLPKILHMSSANKEAQSPRGVLPRHGSSLGLITRAEDYVAVKARSDLLFECFAERHGLAGRTTAAVSGDEDSIPSALLPLLDPVLDAANEIISHTNARNAYDEEKEAWSQVARTMDQLSFSIITPVILLGTAFIFLTGIYNSPPALPFPGDPHDYTEENRRFL